MPSLKDDLENARPGDVIEFRGDEVVGKVIGLRGTPEQPIVVRGADATARIVSSGVRDVANLRLEEAAWVVLQGFALAEATMDEARAVQLFRSNDVLFENLTTGPDVAADHFHLVDSREVMLSRIRCDGAGGRWLRPGVAGHAVYVAEGCENVTVEDLEAVGMLGAPLQCNGEDGEVSDVTLRRCRILGWENGAGVNLCAANRVTIEDLTAESQEDEANGGIRAYQGSRSVTVARYSIELPPGVPKLEGVTVLEVGEPAPPDFDGGTPEPEPQPDEEMQYCPECEGTKVQLGPNGGTIPCATCGGRGTVPLPGAPP